MCTLLNEKITAHEESIRREENASQHAGDDLTSTLHRRLAELHKQQARLLRELPFVGEFGA